MRNYLDLMKHIREYGNRVDDRTGTGSISLFGEQLAFNLQDGFPLLTTKRVHFKSIIIELLWMLQGRTDVKWLQDRGVTIWDEWADENGTIGNGYGKQWRRFEGADGAVVDQIADAQRQIMDNPNSRRILVSAWNPTEIHQTTLPPCHFAFQFRVYGKTLSCRMVKRSTDYFLGAPFNIAQYALLTHLMAKTCDLIPGDLIVQFGDVHLYLDHLNQAATQLQRDPRPLPKLNIKTKRENVWDYEFEDIELLNYDPHPKISAPVSV